MYIRGSKFYADYRDASGIRHRQSFTTAALALEFERTQQTSALKAKLKQLKSGPKLSPLPPSSGLKSSPTRNAKATIIKSRRVSLRTSAATKRPRKSLPAISRKRSRS